MGEEDKELEEMIKIRGRESNDYMIEWRSSTVSTVLPTDQNAPRYPLPLPLVAKPASFAEKEKDFLSLQQSPCG